MKRNLKYLPLIFLHPSVSGWVLTYQQKDRGNSHLIMAENKKSFLLYCDTLSTIEKLSDEQAGKLFRHLLRYVNDLNPEPPDFVTELAFEPIKQSLKRDLKRYESIVEKRREAGRLGGKQKVANASKSKQNVANVAVIDSVSVSDSDSVSDNDILLKKETKQNKLDLLIERQNEFYEELKPFVGTYGKEMIRAFYDYWSEQSKTGFKMRKENEKTWETPKRLGTWQRNDFNKKPSQTNGTQTGSTDTKNYKSL